MTRALHGFEQINIFLLKITILVDVLNYFLVLKRK